MVSGTIRSRYVNNRDPSLIPKAYRLLHHIQISGILYPLTTNTGISYAAFASVFVFAPWLTELVLLLRLLVIYPPGRTSKKMLALVFTFPILVKLVRMTCLIVYLHTYVRETEHNPLAWRSADNSNFRSTPYTDVERFLQIFDNR